MKKIISILGILAFLFSTGSHAVELDYTVATADSIFQNGDFILRGEGGPFKVFAISETRRINTNRDSINPGQNFYFWRPDVDFPPEPGKYQMFITNTDGQQVLNQCYFYFEKRNLPPIITSDELYTGWPLNKKISIHVTEGDGDLVRLSMVIDKNSYKIADFIGGDSIFTVIPQELIDEESIKYDASFFLQQHRTYFEVKELGTYPKNASTTKYYIDFVNSYSYQHKDIVFADNNNGHLQSCLNYFNDSQANFYEYVTSSGSVLSEGLYMSRMMGAEAVVSSVDFSNRDNGYWEYVGNKYSDMLIFIPVILKDSWNSSLPPNVILVSRPDQYNENVDLVGFGDYPVSYINYKVFSDFWHLRSQYSKLNIIEFYAKCKNELINTDTGYPVLKGTALSLYGAIPSHYELHQNYPNPFNSSTTITYNLPVPGYINLTVYNIEGQKVDTLIDKYQSPGSYKIPYRPENLASGKYLYRLTAGNFSEVKKMTLIK